VEKEQVFLPKTFSKIAFQSQKLRNAVKMSDNPTTPAPNLNQPPVGIINPKKILPKTTLNILSCLPTFFLKSIGVTSPKKINLSREIPFLPLPSEAGFSLLHPLPFHGQRLFPFCIHL